MKIILAILFLSALFGFWACVIIFSALKWMSNKKKLELTEEDELEIWNCIKNN